MAINVMLVLHVGLITLTGRAECSEFTSLNSLHLTK
jgi:hypothetical protein